MMTGPSDRTSGALLLDLATVLAVITALVYATGWTYAYYYFGQFALGLLMLEIPYQYFFMYGFWVFKDWWWLLALIFVFVAVAYYVATPLPRLQWLVAERPWLLKYSQVLIVLLAFLLTGWMAANSADHYYLEQHSKGFTAYPHVRVWPKKPLPENTTLRNVYQALPKGAYQLMLQNRDKLFLFKAPPDGKPFRPAVIQIALSEVRALRVRP